MPLSMEGLFFSWNETVACAWLPAKLTFVTSTSSAFMSSPTLPERYPIRSLRTCSFVCIPFRHETKAHPKTRPTSATRDTYPIIARYEPRPDGGAGLRPCHAAIRGGIGFAFHSALGENKNFGR